MDTVPVGGAPVTWPTMSGPSPAGEQYTHGHHPVIVASHAQRSAANSAAYLLGQLTPGLRLLDVGCGPGSITADLAAVVAPGEVVGIDNVAVVLAQAEELGRERGLSNVRYQDASVYALPFPDASFDVIHAHQVLQHLADPVAALAEMRRVVKPGGLVAARDSDFGTMVHDPHEPLLDRWLDLYHQVARSNGAEPDAGRRLLRWARAAGFVDVTATSTSWSYAEDASRLQWGELWAVRITEGAFAGQAVAAGLSSAAELAEIASAWRSWARKPDGFFAFLHGEILARAPGAEP